MTLHLSKPRLLLLFAAPLILLALAWGTPLALRGQLATTNCDVCDKPIDGAAVYLQNCARCHGASGDGRGSTHLTPPARAFGRDKFKFASTSNGIPCDDDLMAIIRRGIPGSAMPAFAEMSDAECHACLNEVRRFTRQGIYQRQIEKALKSDDDPEPAKFAQIAATMSLPGPRLEVPPIPPSTPEAIQRGRAVYLKICANCHGPEGKGDGPQVRDFKNDDGTPNIPRDLTLGQYKAGGEPEQLYLRIMLGIPGTPMPAANTQPTGDIFDVIHYVRSLARR